MNNEKIQNLNHLPRANKFFNNFLWYQFQPADEREAAIFSKVYERSFFTLAFTLMFTAVLIFIFRFFPLNNLFTAIENFIKFPIFLVYAPLIMLITFYQGYRTFSREQISYKKRKIGFINTAGNWTIFIIFSILFTWLLFLIHPF